MKFQFDTKKKDKFNVTLQYFFNVILIQTVFFTLNLILY